jgi:hypothetical protein
MNTRVALLFLTLTLPIICSAQIVPFGLQSDTIVTLVGERVDYQPDAYGFIQGMSLFAGTSRSGVYRTPAHQSLPDWKQMGLQERKIRAMTVQHWGVGPRDGLHIFAATDRNDGDTSAQIFRCEERLYGGADSTWVRADSGLVSSGVPTMAAWYYTGHTPPQPMLAGLLSGGIRRSGAGGVFWEDCSPDRAMRVSSIDVHPLWFGTRAWAVGMLGCFPICFRSTDAGTTWEEVRGVYGQWVAIHPRNPDTVYTQGVYSWYLSRTFDNGVSWNDVILPRHIVIRCMVMDPLFPDNMFVGGADTAGAFALFASRDGGSNWTDIFPPKDRAVSSVTSLFIVSADSTYPRKSHQAILYIGTRGTGVWKLDTDMPLAAERPDALPERMSLSIFPHPVSSRATLEIALPVPAPLRVSVYDIMGREVRSLVEGTREAGKHTVTLDASSLPPGIYCVRMQTRSGIVTRLMNVAH